MNESSGCQQLHRQNTCWAIITDITLTSSPKQIESDVFSILKILSPCSSLASSSAAGLSSSSCPASSREGSFTAKSDSEWVSETLRGCEIDSFPFSNTLTLPFLTVISYERERERQRERIDNSLFKVHGKPCREKGDGFRMSYPPLVFKADSTQELLKWSVFVHDV